MEEKETKWREESLRICELSIPAILILIFQYSINFATLAFVGHLGQVELAAVSISEDVISWFAHAIPLGIGSALETLGGHAVGIGQVAMLGIYLQRCWIVSILTAIALTPIFAFATPILRFLGQPREIVEVSGRFSRWIIPQLYAFAINFPLQNFYLSQSKVWVLTAISFVILVMHILLNLMFVAMLGYGLIGAAVVSNISWWLLDVAEFICLYFVCFGESWEGFSRLAFRDLKAFVKLSFSSAVMMCMELWYYSAFSLLVGLLQNPNVMIGTFSICMSYQQWADMFALGLSAAVSIRISNELGANNSEAPKLIVIVALIASTLTGITFALIVYIWRNQLPTFFTKETVVIDQSTKLTPLLASTILLISIQQVFSGVAIGAGWQKIVVYIRVVSFYLVGLPVGAILALKFNTNTIEVWLGMLVGVLLETICLLLLTFSTNWKNEVVLAESRVLEWGGHSSVVDATSSQNEDVWLLTTNIQGSAQLIELGAIEI